MEDPTPCPLRDSPGFEPGTASTAVSSSTSGEWEIRTPAACAAQPPSKRCPHPGGFILHAGAQ